MQGEGGVGDGDLSGCRRLMGRSLGILFVRICYAEVVRALTLPDTLRRSYAVTLAQAGWREVRNGLGGTSSGMRLRIVTSAAKGSKGRTGPSALTWRARNAK